MAKKNPVAAALDLVLLAAIVAAGEAGLFAPLAAATALGGAGFIEVNPAVTDANGNVAVRATAEGIAKVAPSGDTPAGAADAAGASVKNAFVIEDDIAIPDSLRAARTSVYPFEALNKGQSFFVANTADKPDAAKSLASTVSSANNRYATDDLSQPQVKNRKTGAMQPAKNYERKFTVRPVEGGARVWRTL